jgi:hypothetical protein
MHPDCDFKNQENSSKFSQILKTTIRIHKANCMNYLHKCTENLKIFDNILQRIKK